MRRLDHQEQVSRNRRKFFMKYGFDVIQYTNMMVNASTDDDIISELGITPQQLEHFRKNLLLKNLKSKVMI
ncbi:MAG TPA: hypothetical protein GX691_02985 [Clostridia bacterium]|nr:hypothetical protein [Clostridia bacterium]